jgi:hypothetical protein
MAGIFTAPKISPLPPPNTPSLTDASIQAAADAEALARNKSGRASNILTRPSEQRTAQPSKQQYLGGA